MLVELTFYTSILYFYLYLYFKLHRFSTLEETSPSVVETPEQARLIATLLCNHTHANLSVTTQNDPFLA